MATIVGSQEGNTGRAYGRVVLRHRLSQAIVANFEIQVYVALGRKTELMATLCEQRQCDNHRFYCLRMLIRVYPINIFIQPDSETRRQWTMFKFN